MNSTPGILESLSDLSIVRSVPLIKFIILASFCLKHNLKVY
jgi:hypothetical protein